MPPSYPNGTQNLTVSSMAFHEEEEISEHQDNDQDQFSDQLVSVVMLRRITAEHCVPLLRKYT